MAITLRFEEAAAQYGLRSAFDGSVIGDIINGYYQGDPRSNIRTYIFDSANGFELQMTVRAHSETICTLEAMSMSKAGTILWTGFGSVEVAYPAFNLYEIFGGDDTCTGNSSANFFQADPGSDTIAGGAGIDSVVYPFARSGVNIINWPDHIDVQDTSASLDTLTGIERLVFTDESIAYDIDGPAGQAYRLYQAALDRAPDPGGLGYYIDKLEHGWSEHDIAIGFIHSPEFISRFGTNLTDLEYVQRLYENVLHREGEAGGVAYHLNALHTGQVDREQLLVNFSESPENQGNLMGAMQSGMVYWPVTG
ncbi:MAG TPA: DUF4214 domain-containing protein [Ramlibacter sp.]|nr:DUF4214 domain-containing protein [Ramlibacter sp.]